MTTDDSNGGIAARRAVARWAFRMFRREWRQQILVIVLLTFTVAVAVFGIAGTYNVVPTPDAEFGTANLRLELPAADLADPAEQVAALARWFGTVEVIGHADSAVPGAVARLDVRSQQTDGAFSRPMLALRRGHYPRSASEVALTDGATTQLDARLGSRVLVSGEDRLVVGIVENPADLRDEFALTPDSEVQRADRYTVLASSTPEKAATLPASIPVTSNERRPECHATLICLSAGQSTQATAAAAALGLTTLLLGLVALVAAAAFTVFALRRQRQLGLLSANGATGRHLRDVVLFNGAVVGAIAALLGTILGTAAWVLAAPLLEEPAGHRIDRSHIPWALTAAAMVLAVLTATVASRAPARRAARIPIMAAISGRPPKPRVAHRSALAATALLAIGLAALSRAVDAKADKVTPALLIGGIIALVSGLVFVTPSVLAGLGRIARIFPVAPRLAIRDLSRYRSRSASALAAISLALAMSTVAIVAAGAAMPDASEGNLAGSQMIIRLGDEPLQIPELGTAEMNRVEGVVNTIRASIGADAIPLRVAVDAKDHIKRGGLVLHPAVVLGREVGGGTIRDLGVLYLATKEVLALVDVNPSAQDQHADVLSPAAGTFAFANVADRGSAPTAAATSAPDYSSMPSQLITQSALDENGWVATPASWFLDAHRPLTDEALRATRRAAAAAGLTIETRDDRTGLASIQLAATIVGFVFSLGIVALTLGLLRAETATDLRVLWAAGATRTITQTLSATTGATLAGTGALLGAVSAYAALAAGYTSDIQQLSAVPVLHLTTLLIGVPATAALLSWMISGTGPANGLEGAPE